MNTSLIMSSLEANEIVLHEAQTTVPWYLYAIAVLLTFFPPFVFGLIMILLVRWRRKKTETNVILTNHRVIFNQAWGGSSSFYLGDISRVHTTGLINPKSVVLILKGTILPARTISFVKDAGTLVDKIRSAIKSATSIEAA